MGYSFCRYTIHTGTSDKWTGCKAAFSQILLKTFAQLSGTGWLFALTLWFANKLLIYFRIQRAERHNRRRQPQCVESAAHPRRSRQSIGVVGPRKRDHVGAAKSVQRTTPFAN